MHPKCGLKCVGYITLVLWNDVFFYLLPSWEKLNSNLLYFGNAEHIINLNSINILNIKLNKIYTTAGFHKYIQFYLIIS